MKALVRRTDFLKAFELCAKLASSNPHRPAMGSVLMDVTDGRCCLTADDTEARVVVCVDGGSVLEPGRVLLPRDPVGAVLALRQDEFLEFSTVDDSVMIKEPGSGYRNPCWFKFNTWSPDDFPGALSAPSEGVEHTLPAADLLGLIQLTVFAVDKKSTRYALGGALVETERGGESPTLSFVATDGRRLAKATVGCWLGGTPLAMIAPNAQSVIPARSLTLAGEILRDLDESVTLTVDESTATLRTSKVTMTALLVKGRFPPYRQALPEGPFTSIPLESGEFLRVVDQVNSMTDDINTKSVLFRFVMSEMRLIAGDDEIGKGWVSVPLKEWVKPIDIYIDAHYVAQALRVIGRDVNVSLDIVDGDKPAVLRVEGRGYTYVVMPMTPKEKRK